MPMITVRYVTPAPRPELRSQIAALAARLGAEKLGKKPEVTALIEEADPQGWFIGSKHPTDAGLSAFWMDFKMTSGTNTKDETTSFLKAAFEGMEALLGKCHEECYVLVHANDGDAYGYGGRDAERPLGGSEPRLRTRATRFESASLSGASGSNHPHFDLSNNKAATGGTDHVRAASPALYPVEP